MTFKGFPHDSDGERRRRCITIKKPERKCTQAGSRDGFQFYAERPLVFPAPCAHFEKEKATGQP